MEKAKKIEKPWGYELIWAHTERYAGKILVIEKGKRLSYQYHEKKEETFFLLEGAIRLEFSENGGVRQIKNLKPGDFFHVPPQLRHRIEAVENSRVLEVSSPELGDVVRLEDDYNR
ncbi:MAG: cupin domain-containing protein [bacterium]|nr:cupin domain-containing protein [bacterium]